MRIRRLEADEVALHRELRLAALRDSPDSFEETALDMELRGGSFWEERTRSVTDGRQAMLLAFEGSEACGMVYGLRRTDEGRVGGLWVAPYHRRRGVARALLASVVSWASEQGLRRLGLWAPAENAGVLSLYAGAGFAPNGRERQIDGRQTTIMELERLL